MRYHRAADATKELNHDVGSNLAPLEFTPASKHQGDRGVEVGARDRTKNSDDDDDLPDIDELLLRIKQKDI